MKLSYSKTGGNYGFGYVEGLCGEDRYHLLMPMQSRPYLVAGENDAFDAEPTQDTGEVKLFAAFLCEDTASVGVLTLRPALGDQEPSMIGKVRANITNVDIGTARTMDVYKASEETDWSETKAFWLENGDAKWTR